MPTPEPFDLPFRWLVPSASRPGHPHLVDIEENECSCEDWQFRQSTNPGFYRCRHIDTVRDHFISIIINNYNARQTSERRNRL